MSLNKELKYNQNFDWTCLNCNQVHHEKEFRNMKRRKYICACVMREDQLKQLNTKLSNVNYEVIPQDFILTEKGKIDIEKPILVKCLICGKESQEYYHNIRTQHKRCNCNQTKKFTRNFEVEDFLKKWHPLNQQNFTLLDTEYKNRNTKYLIRCNKCHKEDYRWGITLIDNPIQCKYCGSKSIGEEMLMMILDNYNINYIREYSVTINNHIRKFDIYLPKEKIAFEYDGLQHFKPIPYFGGEKEFLRIQESDKDKEEYCKKNNIKLIRIRYDEKFYDIEKRIRLMFNDQ